MECNIMGCDRNVIKKPCYKTKYKNIVIVKLVTKQELQSNILGTLQNKKHW